MASVLSSKHFHNEDEAFAYVEARVWPNGPTCPHCGGVERISSFGIRQWVDFIGAITPRMAGIYYVECSPKVVDQFNMVANFGGVRAERPVQCAPAGSSLER